MNSKGFEDLAQQGNFPEIEPDLISGSFFDKNMSWRVIYIEESDYLSLYLDNMKVKKQDEEINIPISDIHTLILDNYKINLSVHLINALSNANVNFIICGIDHLPQTVVLPHHGNKLSFQLLKKQLSWSNELKEQVQKFIVKNKIFNQYKLLKYLNKDNDAITILEKYLSEVELGDRTNREGLAAKVYFRAIFGSEFIRFDKDVTNSGLNYGYAILRSQISKVLVAKGLNTSIGFFHIGRENEFNLSDDFIEPFRPIIDHFVHNNLTTEPIFLRKHRLEIIKETTKTAYINGMRQTLFNAIQIYIENILKYTENNDEEQLQFLMINYEEL